MNKSYYETFLVSHTATIRGLAQGLTEEQAHWRPDASSWSVVEVINHLVDEEIEDFRAHLGGLLNKPIKAWTPIDPQGWVSARQYQARELEPSMEAFVQARGDTLAWLETLTNVDWTAAYELPWGKLSAGDLLASWVAHDLLHIRQLTELNYALLSRSAVTERIDYAGEW